MITTVTVTVTDENGYYKQLATTPQEIAAYKGTRGLLDEMYHALAAGVAEKEPEQCNSVAPGLMHPHYCQLPKGHKGCHECSCGFVWVIDIPTGLFPIPYQKA